MCLLSRNEAVFVVFVLRAVPGPDAESLTFDAMAEDLEFIMVYPDGKNRRWESPDGIAFFDSMIAIQKKYSIDSARIYAAGHSAGAIKAYQLAACLRKIAAIAHRHFSDAPRDDLEPVSVLHIHSRNDEMCPAGSGSGTCFPLKIPSSSGSA